jgi:molybdopterin biosynthesis enzyme
VRLARISPGRTPPAATAGGILTRDLAVGGLRLTKGTRLTAGHLALIGAAPLDGTHTVLLPDPWEVHEDEAALRLAAAASAGRGELTVRGPAQSRVDLVAAVPGVVEIRLPALERLNRIDPLEVFTVLDGQVVEPGDLVASVKIAPHLVAEAVLIAGEAIARRGGPVVRVRPFRDLCVAVLVKGDVGGAARARFERAIGAKVAGLRCRLGAVVYVADADRPVTEALGTLLATGPDRPDIILTAGATSTDPLDSVFVAIAALGGTVVRRGVPAHPGSMLWLADVGGVPIVGLPSCGAYSMATAADLLLPRLVAGQPANASTVARLAHGGILDRSQRFRFPRYARDLAAPEG